MIRHLSIGLLCISILICCRDNSGTLDQNNVVDPGLTREKNNRSFGGLFRLNESVLPGSLFPLEITDVVAARTAAQVYEGLFTLDPENLDPLPCLVKNWRVSEGGDQIIVELKGGVYFHDDPCFPDGRGREMVAEDIVYCFTNLASPLKNNLAFHVVENAISGSKEYFQAQLDGHYELDFEGIKKTGDHQVTFYINGRPRDFLYVLARPETFIYPKEAVDFYGFDLSERMVGTGPFEFVSWNGQDGILLSKNENYHQTDREGFRLPYLEGLSISFIQDKKTELFKFKNGDLEMIYSLPHDYIIDILEDSYEGGASGFSHFTLQRIPELATEILGFNLLHPLYSNKNLRKAIAFSIDRKAIVDNILHGQAYEAGNGGFVPPGYKKYDYSKIRGYSYNADSAEIYFKRSGFEKQTLPRLSLHLASRGNFNIAIGREIRSQIQNTLGIEIHLEIESFSKLVSNVTDGSEGFYRIGWSADYPSIMEFLSIFSSETMKRDPNKKSFPNVARYSNDKYDKWLNIAQNSIVDSVVWNAYANAERILMADCPVVILWYDEGYRLLQPNVQNFPINSIQYRDFRRVFLEKPEILIAD